MSQLGRRRRRDRGSLGEPRRSKRRFRGTGGFGRQGQMVRNAVAFGEALKDPLFKRIFLKIVGGLTSLIPVAGPFVSQVLNAMADDPNFDFGDFLREMFSAGAGVFLKTLAEAALSGVVPAGASNLFKLAARVAPSVAQEVGKRAALATVRGATKVGRVVDRARNRSIEQYERSR